MVFTLKQLSEDDKIRIQCEARERYERDLLSEYASGKAAGYTLGESNGFKLGEAAGFKSGEAAGFKSGATEGRAQEIVESGIEAGLTAEVIKNRLVKKLSITIDVASDYYKRFADNRYSRQSIR